MAIDPRQYRLSPQAELDLEEIWAFTVRNWSSEQAERYVSEVLGAIEGLASGKRFGRSADQIRNGYWKYAVGRHLVLYRLAADCLDVIRILHQRMDLAAQLDTD